MACLTLGACSALAGTASARTYFVSNNGRDSARGNSPRHPWRSVSRVDKAHLRPGDRVLFRGSQAFDDNTLMPGWGYSVSGTRRSPIVFGSYGPGRARLIYGIWLGTHGGYPRGPSHLSFVNLALGWGQGFQGTGDHIALEHLLIQNLLSPSSREIGISTQGSYWLIAGNHIDRVGGSGMLLGFNANSAGDRAGGHSYRVVNNVITNTGLDGSIGYPTHGIYLKVSHAYIGHNWISGFRDDGVSARYHDATITRNVIAGGTMGIGWYQYDPVGGTSHFTRNTIVNSSDVAIFVCGVREGCYRPLESFVIKRNKIRTSRKRLNLQPTRGHYYVADNR